MRNWRLFYWLAAGLLIGAGLVSFDVYFIAFPIILVGLAMIIVGIFRFKSTEFWAVFIGLGTIPAFILVFDIVTASPPCTGQIFTIPPGGTSASCSYIPQSYYVFAIIFAAIALAGVGGLVLGRNRVQR
jgi:hypothetical protein